MQSIKRLTFLLALTVFIDALMARPIHAETLPGGQVWKEGVSSYLFGSNDTEEWTHDNVQTDPRGVIQPAMKRAHMQLQRSFVFHYSRRDGHRTSIGPEALARRRLPDYGTREYSIPTPQADLYTPRQPTAYEVENRIGTIEKMGMQCLVVFPNISTTAEFNDEPSRFHRRYKDPMTGYDESDLDFARKVVAYLGDRCNLYEIGNEPDLDSHDGGGGKMRHMDIHTYVARWSAFVRALRKINPHAKFIGPVVHDRRGGDCSRRDGSPYAQSRAGECYLQHFLRGVKDTDVEPDAISFHWYPCHRASDGFNEAGNCGPDQARSYAEATREVRGWVGHILGRDLPIGITEWNFDPGKSPLGANDAFMEKFTEASLRSMMDARLDFANQFSTQSYAGDCYLDMFDSCHHTDAPKMQFKVMERLIRQYRPAAH